MPYDFVSPPGVGYGPCSGDCNHTDCASLRVIANAVCPFCGYSIGYNEPFFEVVSGVAGVSSFAHQTCLLYSFDFGVDDETIDE